MLRGILTDYEEPPMYYIIETVYVGPNQRSDEYCDADTVVISTLPARTNRSFEIRIEGWCGTTGGWATYAYGEYDTLEDARAAVVDIFGAVRKDESEWPRDSDEVERYKKGEYEPVGMQTTADIVWPGIKVDITADSSDEEISRLVDAYEADANREGMTLMLDVVQDLMIERRADLRAKDE